MVLTVRSLEVQKNSEIFQGCSVILVGSGGAVRAWKILDFEFPKHFNIAIQANKMLWHTVKINYDTRKLQKTSLLKLICTDGKAEFYVRGTLNWTQFFWILDENVCRCKIWGNVSKRPFLFINPNTSRRNFSRVEALKVEKKLMNG